MGVGAGGPKFTHGLPVTSTSYSQFARYYNQYAPDQGKQFTLYNYTEDRFVVLTNPVAHSDFYLTEHPPHKSNKPYNKSTSFTSLLQQSHH